MPAKRSRLGRSSSFGEVNVSNNQTPSFETRVAQWGKRPAPAAVPKPLLDNAINIPKSSPVKQEQSRRCIFTLASPERETVKESSEMDSNRRLAGFLERCFYCKRKFKPDGHMYMFGYLCAFCSPKCRVEHINTDKEAKELYEAVMTEAEKVWIEKLEKQAGNRNAK